MTGRALTLAGLAAFVLLVLAGVAAVLLLEDSGAGTTRGAWGGPPDAPAAAPSPPIVLGTLAPGTGTGEATPVAAAEDEAPPLHEPAPPSVTRRGLVRKAAAPARAEPGATGWDTVDLALRPAALGPELAGPVSDGLAEARGAIQHCFDAEALLRSRPSRAAPGSQGAAVLILRLEAIAGRLSIAGIEEASTGNTPRTLVECARKALLGYEFDAPAVHPPERYRVSFTLM